MVGTTGFIRAEALTLKGCPYGTLCWHLSAFLRPPVPAIEPAFFAGSHPPPYPIKKSHPYR
jgi:hypothetical protein